MNQESCVVIVRYLYLMMNIRKKIFDIICQLHNINQENILFNHNMIINPDIYVRTTLSELHITIQCYPLQEKLFHK